MLGVRPEHMTPQPGVAQATLPVDSCELLGADNLPGFVGVVVVLMEEDGWSNSIADAGYSAFVDAVHAEPRAAELPPVEPAS